MAKCKLCGNAMTDEMYAMNNGMCDLCLRSANGEDDPIVASQEAPVKFSSLQDRINDARAWRDELGEKEKFHPEEFEGKSIGEFKFPDFIVPKVVYCADSLNGEALLLTRHHPFSTVDIVIIFLMGMVFFPFVAAGLFLIGLLFYSIFIGNVSGLTGNLLATIVLFIFSCVWNGIIWYVVVWNVMLKGFYIYDWVLLKDKGVECCSGHQFKSEKAKRYEFRNINIRMEMEHGKDSNDYWIEVSNGGNEKAFKLDVSNERQGKYWESFLKWYISNYRSGHGAGKRS